MSGDPFRTLPGIGDRVEALGTQAIKVKTLRDRLRKQETETRIEIETLGARVERLIKISELFRALMDLLVNDQVRAVERVVTEGLTAIFHDQMLSFEAELSSKRNKVWIDFFIRSGVKEDPLSHRGKPLKSFGGGASSVTSLVLRLLTLMRLKRAPFLVLDESLGAVSEDYVERTGRFLSEFVHKAGMNVILVTHKTGYLEHADQAYQCRAVADGVRNHLEVAKIR